MQWPSHKQGVSRRTGMTGFLAAILLACLGWAWEAQACAIPVFRYALEHWPAQPCRIIVYHQGVFSPEQRAMVDALGQSNLCSVETCDVAAPSNMADSSLDDPMKIWRSLPHQPALPTVTLSCWGGRKNEPQAVLSRPFNRETVDALTTKTPFHREVARRLLTGDSVVWVVLTAPDAARNDAARRMLTTTLHKMEQELTLPNKRDPNDTTFDIAMNTSIPLRMRFTVLEVPGRGLDADLFRSALRSITTNAVTMTEPVVIPVFGRGLALDAFYGPALDAETVQSTCEFLCGDCSCNVKDMQLGVSLFMPINWDAVVDQSQTVEEALPPLIVPGAVDAVTPGKEKTVKGDSKANTNVRLFRSLWALLGIGVLAVIVGTLKAMGGRKGGR